MKYNVTLLFILFSFMLFTGRFFPTPLNNRTVSGTITRILPAVVELRPGFAHRLGAGVLISEDGWIMTAKHVVEGQKVMIATTIGGVKYMSTTIIADPNSDIAILKIDANPEDGGHVFPHVQLRQDYPRLGEFVFAIGHPLGVFNSISWGVVSNVHKNILPYGRDLIITDAEITNGNSGGPLLDMRGRLVGIVVAGTGYWTGFEANLVVPVVRGRKLLEKYVQQQGNSARCDEVDVSAL